MAIYEDYKLIDAQINHIVNRGLEGTFSVVGDSGDTADKRYSDDAVTQARRESTYRLLDAIGANPSHPFWGEMKSDVEVTHNDKIPAHFGEIGIPKIVGVAPVTRTYAGASKDPFDSTVTIPAGPTANLSSDDVGATFEVYDTSVVGNDVLVLAGTVQSVSSVTAFAATAYTTGDVTTDLTLITATELRITRPITGDDYATALGAKPDEIDSWRADRKGTFSDLFGTGPKAYDAEDTDGMPSLKAGRYSTADGVLKFVGHRCMIPMIQRPTGAAEADTLLRTVAGVTKAGGTNQIVAPADTGLFSEASVGQKIVIGGVSATISQYLDPDNVVVGDYTVGSAATAVAASVLSVYRPGRTAAQAFADTHVPHDLAPLVVKLSLPMLVKEGDNLFRIAAYLGAEGERELMGVRQGGIKSAPVDPTKIVQMSQRLT